MNETIRSTLRPMLRGLVALLAVTAVTGLGGCAHKSSAHRGHGDDYGMNGSKDDDRLPVCGVRVHFDYDSAQIPDGDRPGLASSAKCMSDDRALKVTVEGNADERGTEEYNLALGDQRATSVAKYLKSLGAEEHQIRTVSYGEEKPLCADHDEACWAKNRRAAVRPAADKVAGKPMAGMKDDK